MSVAEDVESSIRGVNTDFAPSTQRSERRRVQRGDFGPFTTSKGNVDSTFPAGGKYDTLTKLIDGLDNVSYCEDTSSANVSTLPQNVRTAIESLPAAKRCLAAAKYLANSLLEEQKVADKRRVKLPRYHSPVTTESMDDTSTKLDVAYSRLTGMQKAKKHLDKARQMYLSGKSLLAKALIPENMIRRTTGEVIPNPFFINRGRALQYNVDLDNKQFPRENSSSALWHLYKAYTLVREYEANPPPPLKADLTPNEVRVEEDERYNFIMGTQRMLPNRLGIGDHARKIWLQSGILDSNYYMNNEGRSTRVGVDGEEAPLWSSINGETAQGPERVLALKGWIDAYNNGLLRTTLDEQYPEFILPDSDKLREMGFANTPEWTDAGRALLDIHSHFPSPNFILSNNEDGSTSPTLDRDDTKAPPKLRYKPFAEIDKPFPSENNGEAWPRLQAGGMDLPSIDYIPPFMPTGQSINPSGEGMPFIFLGDAVPTLGEPDPRTRPEQWDARQSAAILASFSKRLSEQALSNALNTRMMTIENLGTEDPEYDPLNSKGQPYTALPIALWPEGRLATATTFFRGVPSTSYPTLNSDEDVGRPMTQPVLQLRELGVSNTMFLQNEESNRQEFRETVANPAGATQLGVNSLHPFGIRPLDVPQHVRLSDLPQTRQEQLRMLMHGLFLLSAPVNAWMKSNLPNRLWLQEPPLKSRDPGSVTYGDSAPGNGYFQRSNSGLKDADKSGWRSIGGVFGFDPQGGVRGRSWKLFENEINNLGTPSARTLREHIDEKIPGIVFGSVPFGPFQLDPEFGTAHHIPHSSYSYNQGKWFWLVKTNQLTVYNENTWGLDFY